MGPPLTRLASSFVYSSSFLLSCVSAVSSFVLCESSERVRRSTSDSKSEIWLCSCLTLSDPSQTLASEPGCLRKLPIRRVGTATQGLNVRSQDLVSSLDGGDATIRALKVRDDHVHLRELGDDFLVYLLSAGCKARTAQHTLPLAVVKELRLVVLVRCS